MIATYIAIDSFGTATNVTVDAAMARVVNTRNRRDRRRHGQADLPAETALA